MLIFWRLVLAHFIADFTLQTNKVAQWKRVSQLGMVVHVLCHPVMYVLMCWPLFVLDLGASARTCAEWLVVRDADRDPALDRG